MHGHVAKTYSLQQERERGGASTCIHTCTHVMTEDRSRAACCCMLMAYRIRALAKKTCILCVIPSNPRLGKENVHIVLAPSNPRLGNTGSKCFGNPRFGKDSV
eukprot:364863-Chlamydomonas_euryale.AAC.1